MYYVLVRYADGSYCDFHHINKIEFYEDSAYKTLEGDEILSHRYRLYNLVYFLFSDDSANSIDVSNAISFRLPVKFNFPSPLCRSLHKGDLLPLHGTPQRHALFFLRY